MTNAKNLQELEQENRLLRQILDHISDGVKWSQKTVKSLYTTRPWKKSKEPTASMY